jgi:hypothetical protein
MRDVLRNPMSYYLMAPLLVAIWPLLVWAVYLPRAEKSLEDESALCVEGRTCVLDILQNDPDRLDFAKNADVAGEFSYAKAIDRVANLCRIPATKCTYNAGAIIKSSNKRRQNARVKLTDIDIVQAATFLSTIQSTWVNLECDRAKLTKKKGLPDQWDVDFTFWYYY